MYILFDMVSLHTLILHSVLVHSNNCFLIMMSIYLETFLEMHPTSKYLFTEDDNELAPLRLKGTCAHIIRDYVWQKQDFINLAPEDSIKDDNGYLVDIATHSGRKCPTEYATNCGASGNEIEIRWRWKGQKGGRAGFRYIS